MLSPEQYALVAQSLPVLQKVDPGFARTFQSTAFWVRIPAGKDVFVDGDPVEAIALLLSGRVRVYKIGETGREITLYRFGSGESCVLTANAILSRGSFPALATVEEDAEAVMIPAAAFREWVGRYESWREFVFDLLSDRLSSMLEVVDEVVFRRMDSRVATYLVQKSAYQNVVRSTHQEIAAELGSSREVVSRILEDFSRQGLIESGRGVIQIMDKKGLISRSGV